MDRIREISRRISERPTDHVQYYELGKAYIQVNEFNEAEAALNKAIELAPDETRYHALLARAYLKQGEYRRAKSEFEKTLLLDPSNLMAHKNLGLILEYHLGDARGALAHYHRYAQLGGDDSHILERTYSFKADSKFSRGNQGLAAINRLLTAVATPISRNKAAVEKVLTSLGMCVLLAQCFHAFPVVSPSAAGFICLGVGALILFDAKIGTGIGLLLMFFPIAQHSVLIGYLYAAGVLLVCALLRPVRPIKLILVLLMPIILKMNVAYAVCLGAAFLLGPRRGATFAAVASATGLGYMVVSDMNQLGPFLVNHSGSPMLLNPIDYRNSAAFFTMEWTELLISPELIDSVRSLVDSDVCFKEIPRGGSRCPAF